MKLKPANYSETALNEILEGFTQHFGHLWRFIEADNIKDVRGEKPKWFTETRFPLETWTLLQKFLDPDVLVGIRFSTNKESRVKYLMLDIDRQSEYHPLNNPEKFRRLLHAFEDAGLPGYVLAQSSHSEGIHTYFPLSKAIPTFAASCFLKKIVENAGFKIKDGQLEAFPNCKSFSKKKIINYKAHRLPLQPESGSILLGDDLEPISNDIRVFLKQMDWVAENKNIVDEQLKEGIEVAKQAVYCERVSRKKAKASLEKWKRELESYRDRGFTASGQTNELLCKFSTYCVVFAGLKGAELQATVQEMIENAPGYEEHCNHKHEIEKRVKERAEGAEKYYWAVGEMPKRIGTYKDIFGNVHEAVNKNQEKAEETLNRLLAVIKHIKGGVKKIPTTLSGYRELVKEVSRKLFNKGFGNSTLNKASYAKEWKPAFEELKSAQTEETQAEEDKHHESEKEAVKEEINEELEIEKIIEEIEEANNSAQKAESIVNKELSTPLEKGAETETLEVLEIKGCPHPGIYEGFGNSSCGEIAEGDICFYRGNPSSGLINLEKIKYPQLKTIQKNQLVKIISTLHSSDLRDNPPEEKLIYVQPIQTNSEKLEDWKDEGIAVKQTDLEKLDIPTEFLKDRSIISLTNSLKIDGDRQKVDKKNLLKPISREFVEIGEDFW